MESPLGTDDVVPFDDPVLSFPEDRRFEGGQVRRSLQKIKGTNAGHGSFAASLRADQLVFVPLKPNAPWCIPVGHELVNHLTHKAAPFFPLKTAFPFARCLRFTSRPPDQILFCMPVPPDSSVKCIHESRGEWIS